MVRFDYRECKGLLPKNELVTILFLYVKMSLVLLDVLSIPSLICNGIQR